MKRTVFSSWTNSSVLLGVLAFSLLFATQLGCSAFEKYKARSANTAVDEEPAPLAAKDEWKEYTLENTDITVTVPGKPKPLPIPAAMQRSGVGSVHQVPLGKGMIMIMEVKFPPGRPAVLKNVADASMTSFQKQDPDTQYEVSVVSDNKARITGQTSAKFKEIANFSINGCYLIRNVKKTGSAWSVVVISDPARAADVTRVMDSVVVNGIDENCR